MARERKAAESRQGRQVDVATALAKCAQRQGWQLFVSPDVGAEEVALATKPAALDPEAKASIVLVRVGSIAPAMKLLARLAAQRRGAAADARRASIIVVLLDTEGEELSRLASVQAALTAAGADDVVPACAGEPGVETAIVLRLERVAELRVTAGRTAMGPRELARVRSAAGDCGEMDDEDFEHAGRSPTVDRGVNTEIHGGFPCLSGCRSLASMAAPLPTLALGGASLISDECGRAGAAPKARTMAVGAGAVLPHGTRRMRGDELDGRWVAIAMQGSGGAKKRVPLAFRSLMIDKGKAKMHDGTTASLVDRGDGCTLLGRAILLENGVLRLQSGNGVVVLFSKEEEQVFSGTAGRLKVARLVLQKLGLSMA